MRIILIIIAFCLVFCTGSTTTQSDQSIPSTDGWKLVGEKDGCRMYHKYFYHPPEDHAGRGHDVYWSICTRGTVNSSITAID